MHPVFKTIVILIIGILIFLGYFGFTLYRNVQEISSTPELELDQQRRFIEQALSELPISITDREQGFWYTIKGPDGSDAIGFIDPEALARKGMNQADIAALIEKLRSARLTSRDSMSHVPSEKLPAWAQFHNDLYSFKGPGKFQAQEEHLETAVRSKTAAPDDFERLAYIAELRGDYKRRDALRSDLCKKFNDTCKKADTITISGVVFDTSGAVVAGALVRALGKDSVTTRTDEQGRYSLTVPVVRPEKIRLSAVKLNFSEGIAAVLASPGGTQNQVADTIVLAASVGHVTLNTQKGVVSGENTALSPDGSFFEVHTSQSKYRIPKNGIVTKAGVPYKGIVDVYLYEFNNDTVPSGLTNVDTFDQVMGYAGNLMKSFGMPYIQFFTTDGVELHVLKSNPMTLTYRLANIDDLRSNAARIYGPLTDSDMNLMIDASLAARDGYPIDREWLIKNNLLRFPAFWVYDRSKGVWESIGMRVLNLDGTIEAPFYTLSKPL